MTNPSNMKRIEVGKTYKTRNGREVRIYAVDGGKRDPIHGAVMKTNGQWVSYSWRADGHYLEQDSDWDIVIPPLRYEGVFRVGDLNDFSHCNRRIYIPLAFEGKKVKYILEQVE